MSPHLPPSVATSHPLSRRDAIARILAATAAASALNFQGFAAELTPHGIGFDPNLLKKEIPWPRLLTEAEKRIVTVLADLILPADQHGPAASEVGVPDFIDEWVSAPYEQQVRDRKVIRDGLAWLDKTAQQQFGKGFADASPEQRETIVKNLVAAGPERKSPELTFFILFRDRSAGGYFTTREGWKALGYVGNVPTAEFAPPPAEALKQAGLA